ncbi:hypothetical protein [Nitrosospira multiformis]|uniref:hypothetical protein n=1 Tax=Nitrosospira multiformis TaxID=1231 RepID=UPI0011608339|nr:hypothetical protein [Nitrosospira multiformis]
MCGRGATALNHMPPHSVGCVVNHMQQRYRKRKRCFTVRCHAAVGRVQLAQALIGTAPVLTPWPTARMGL